MTSAAFRSSFLQLRQHSSTLVTFLLLFGDAANTCEIDCGTGINLACAPGSCTPDIAEISHALDDRQERNALGGQFVLDARRHLGVGGARDHFSLFQSP